MKATYFVNKKFDAHMLYNLFRSIDPLGAEQRAKETNIPLEIVNYIQQQDSFELIKGTPLFNYADEQYTRFEGKLKQSRIAYKKEWGKVEHKFFNTVEQVTESRFKYDEYFVLLSAFLVGVSNDGDNSMVLVTGLADNPAEITFLTAYEILMSHMRTIVYQTFPDEVADPLQKLWAICEATAIFILCINMSGSWFGSVNNVEEQIQSLNYQKLKQVVPELRPLYENRESFHSYLINANKFLVENYKDYSFSD